MNTCFSPNDEGDACGECLACDCSAEMQPTTAGNSLGTRTVGGTTFETLFINFQTGPRSRLQFPGPSDPQKQLQHRAAYNMAMGISQDKVGWPQATYFPLTQYSLSTKLLLHHTSFTSTSRTRRAG